MKRSPQLDATLSELCRWNASVVSITDTANSHTKVTFTFDGKTQFIICGNNAASFEAPKNARRIVRHMLGIKREKITGRRRVRRNYANRPAPTAPEHITLGSDPWAGIKGTPILQKATSFAADQAWARLFGSFLIATGHVPVNPTIRQAVGIAA